MWIAVVNHNSQSATVRRGCVVLMRSPSLDSPWEIYVRICAGIKTTRRKVVSTKQLLRTVHSPGGRVSRSRSGHCTGCRDVFSRSTAMGLSQGRLPLRLFPLILLVGRRWAWPFKVLTGTLMAILPNVGRWEGGGWNHNVNILQWSYRLPWGRGWRRGRVPPLWLLVC